MTRGTDDPTCAWEGSSKRRFDTTVVGLASVADRLDFQARHVARKDKHSSGLAVVLPDLRSGRRPFRAGPGHPTCVVRDTAPTSLKTGVVNPLPRPTTGSFSFVGVEEGCRTTHVSPGPLCQESQRRPGLRATGVSLPDSPVGLDGSGVESGRDPQKSLDSSFSVICRHPVSLRSVARLHVRGSRCRLLRVGPVVTGALRGPGGVLLSGLGH